MLHKIIACLYLSLIFVACSSKSTQPIEPTEAYDQLLFERQGDGNLVFTVRSTSSIDTFRVQVIRIGFRDTTIHMRLVRNSTISGLLDTLHKSFHGDIPPDGSFAQSPLPTGTWACIYFVKSDFKKEITNTDLRTTLLKLEDLILVGYSTRKSPTDTPPWVIELIEKFQHESVGNPPQSIWRYEYKGQVVFYTPPQCCDQFSVLYNASGDILCAPDGGFTGNGDDRCTDFFQERKNGILVWQDCRTR